jgi:hypothetical protein
MSFLLQVRGFAQLRGGLLKFCTWLRTQNQYPRVPICTSVSLDRMSTLGIVRDNSAVRRPLQETSDRHAYVVLSTLSRTALRLSIVPRPTVRQQSAEQQSVVSVSVARVVSTTGPTPVPRLPAVQAGVLYLVLLKDNKEKATALDNKGRRGQLLHYCYYYIVYH